MSRPNAVSPGLPQLFHSDVLELFVLFSTAYDYYDANKDIVLNLEL